MWRWGTGWEYGSEPPRPVPPRHRQGARTSPEAAQVVGTTRGSAKVMVHNLARRGLVRWTGETVARVDGQSGRPARVYRAD